MTRLGAVVGAFALMSGAGLSFSSGRAPAAVAPVGEGFVVTPADLTFILKQIKIAERHAQAFEGNPAAAVQPNPNPAADPSYCLSMIGSATDQVPNAITTYGLRTVDGQCNNLASVLETTAANNATLTPTYNNHPTIGAADQPFPRLATPVFSAAEASAPGFPAQATSSYAQKLAGNIVYDSQPRLVSNLIVDQSSTNPAAIAAAEFPVRSQGNPGLFPCTTDPTPLDGSGTPGIPAGCVPSHQTLFIPNVTTDVGLSPPYNSLFTFFGQFFDHGVDQTVKSGGTVIVPLRADDPLITLGPDGVAGNGDEVLPQNAFIALTRAQNQPGPDGALGTTDDVQNANNTDTPWVDQSQTYTSHGSHQAFLREYDMVACIVAGNPTTCPSSTGRLLGGLNVGETYTGSPDGRTGISTWKSTKLQAATKLGLQLADTDVTNIPMLLTDPYGNLILGPARGLAQYVTTVPVDAAHPTGVEMVEGNTAGGGVPVPANVRHFDTPFLTDIAHNADPSERDTDNNGIPDAFPTPDADDTPSANFAAQAGGTYDDEMLNAHFTCGDGRCNENIALSTIHQIFHSEHDRLANEYDGTSGTLASDATLSADFHDTNCAIGCATNNAALPRTFAYGERLFQAARFVTEMEYQHLVFEEFARKVQPAVRLFHVYSPDINPAVKAEFAHAVYRFGHSMLDDQVARTSPNGADNSLPLLTAFLNPPEFFNTNGTFPGSYSPEQAAGAIVMGSSDQVGNELDEFISQTLRNNLLGLPLDLATLNLTRARSEGIPPLNQVRRDIFNQTNDGQLTPYTSWSDFGQHLKHPESLINFVAAYGTHPSIRDSGPDGILGNADDVTTATAKRDAARAIVNPRPLQAGPDGILNTADDILADIPPADAADFMFSTDLTTNWASGANGVTITGLDSVDLWVGGLAEITNLFGGLLGTTFNYVFQTQLEDLQDGDRFYYLARTPGMNLRTQLEGNSFAELIQRNTDGTNTLKADAFSTADCKFQLANVAFPAPNGSFLTGAGSVADDPSTPDCNENRLLLRQPNGTVQYRQFNSVDPSGINGQAVYNGTPNADRVFGGNDNDTFWGGASNDVIEGGGGDDIALGGDGNDIITDLGGADVPKGGPGNDALDGGPGDDIPMGGTGSDFINGGSGDNETFAGAGNDFVIAGLGADAVFGDSGDDWIQGGSGQDLLQGDHGAPFFDDPGQTAPGNDFFIGQPGENDYDAEGGDDVMAQNAAVDRNAGAAGFDWAFHQYNTIPADDDLNINRLLVGVPIQLVVLRDRWQETEAISGAGLNDAIRGDDLAPASLGGAGFSGCNALDAAGVARIKGLDALVTPAMLTVDPAALAAASAAGRCPLSGLVWGDGNILIGGGGNDTLEGRGANDILDGDRSLTIAISVRTNPADPATEIGRTDLMEHAAAAGGNFGAGTAGMTLQQAVFAGLVDPGNLVGVREIGTTGVLPADIDTAVFSGPTANYTFAAQVNGSVVVTDNVGLDGVDTLWNMEQLSFCATPGVVRGTCAVARNLVTIAPSASAAPAAGLTFAARLTGTTSAAQVLTVTNTGIAPLVVSGVSATAGFAATTTCTTVASGSTCPVSVTFTPTVVGANVGTVSIATNALGSPTVVNVTGIGVGPSPTIAVTPATLAFGTQVTATSSAARVITVSNTGSADLNVGTVTVTGADSGSFAATSGCAAPVAAGGSCTINVVFTPASLGAKTATVSIPSDDTVSGTKTVSVTGTGVNPALTLAPATLTFAAQNLGSAQSAIQTVALSNTGAAAVTTSSVTVGGPNANQFVVTFNAAACVRTRPAGAAFCNISVRFRPTAASGAGIKTATITVASNAGSVVSTVTGTGVAVPTIATAGTLGFGRRPLGSTTTTTFTVTNTGTAPLTIGAPSTTGAAYSVASGTCISAVAPGGTCQLNVTFKPTIAGNPITGTLVIPSDASNGTRTVNLTGRAP